MFFDLNIKGSSLENNLNLAMEASKYGWEHINFSYNQNDFKDALDIKNELSDKLEGIINFDYTLEIYSNNVNEVKKTARKFRNKSSCISVIGGNLKINRATVETIQIDVLSRPYLRRYDGGINHVLAKEAVKNNVAIELCFKDVLRSYLSHRSKVISNFKDIYTLYRTFFKQTGLSDSEIDKSFLTAQNILEFNEDRDKMIFHGVRRVDDEA